MTTPYPGIHIGDLVFIDFVEYLVENYDYNTDTWWLKANSPYAIGISMRSYSTEELVNLWNARNLKIEVGKVHKMNHLHSWKEYVGFREVYEYCECGEKKGKEWYELGDGKKKTGKSGP